MKPETGIGQASTRLDFNERDGQVERIIVSIHGKKILVTGALGGIGKAIVERLVAHHSKVIAVDIKENAGDFLGNREDLNGIIDFHTVDMTDRNAVQGFFNEARPILDDLYAVVHTIGVAGPRGPIDELDSSLLPAVFATNVLSIFFLLQSAVPILKRHNCGRIVAVGSVAGRLGYANRSAYASTKWALEGLCKSLAAELGPHHITVNTVSPGPVNGPPIDAAIRRLMDEKCIPEVDARSILTSQSAMGALIDPEEVADAVLFLLSPSAKHITGQTLSVDAGVTHLN